MNAEKKKKEENLIIHKQFDNLKKDPGIIEVFDAMKRSTELLFSQYCKSTTNKSGAVPSTLPFAGFNKFCTSFNISPGLMGNDKVLSVFRLTTKSKRDNSIDANSINQQEFEECLLRLSQVSRSELQKDLAIQFESETETLKGFFEYLAITSDSKNTRDLIKSIELKNKNMHPRDKKKMKNKLNASISRDLTPSVKAPKKKAENPSGLTSVNLKLPESEPILSEENS